MKVTETIAPNNSAIVVALHKPPSSKIKGKTISKTDKNTSVLSVEIINELTPSFNAVK